ncbi:MAG: hybrid sensor histidine kinase/response regulator [Magnetococcales bacterium]|nr:hybrid sensor histidine kinase/response regulator [Magnetococcales bacterium]
MDEKELLIRLREAFRVESEERLAGIGRDLTALEQGADPEKKISLLEQIYRDAHSLKGAARAVNYPDVESVCQALEGVLSGLKQRRLPISSELFDLIHGTVEFIEGLLADNPEHSTKDSHERVCHWVDRLEAVSQGKTVAPPSRVVADDPKQPLPSSAAPSADRVAENPPPNQVEVESPVAKGRADELSEETQAGADPAPVPQPTPALAVAVSTVAQKKQPKQPPKQAEVSRVRVSADNLDRLLRKAEELIALKLAGHQHLKQLKESCRVFDVWHRKWSEAEPAWRNIQKREGANEPSRFGNGAGSLTTFEGFLAWNRTFMKEQHRDVRAMTKDLDTSQRGLDRMVDDLLESAKQLIMLPSSTVLDSFPRMVRQIAREQEKKVNFVVEGQELAIDRRILDEMKDPLLHLLRNAVDHGIEHPKQREKAGKPPEGTLRIKVSQLDGDKVEIAIEDDGRGLDLEQIRASAQKKAIMTASELAALDVEQTIDLIFHSGVSAAPILTNISGRGLGMAIVRERVEKLSGSLRVQNRPGKGLVFTIRLPISLTTFRGVIIQTAGEKFAIPSAQVDRVLQVSRDSLRMVENRTTLSYNGRPLAVVDLARVLGLSGANSQMETNNSLRIVVLNSGSRRQIGFLVADILEEQELLVKGLGKQLRRVKNISGAAILGSGQVVPVLHVKDLMIRAVMAPDLSVAVSTLAESAEQKPTRILVVEDSITSRMLLKNVLEAAGFRVTTAVDGMEGLTSLKTSEVDLVISDVEMPRMNGFEMTAAIRADEQLAHTPLILMTSLSSQEDRERGVDAGANAYLIKSHFDQTILIETIGRLL